MRKGVSINISNKNYFKKIEGDKIGMRIRTPQLFTSIYIV